MPRSSMEMPEGVVAHGRYGRKYAATESQSVQKGGMGKARWGVGLVNVVRISSV